MRWHRSVWYGIYMVGAAILLIAYLARRHLPIDLVLLVAVAVMAVGTLGLLLSTRRRE